MYNDILKAIQIALQEQAAANNPNASNASLTSKTPPSVDFSRTSRAHVPAPYSYGDNASFDTNQSKILSRAVGQPGDNAGSFASNNPPVDPYKPVKDLRQSAADAKKKADSVPKLKDPGKPNWEAIGLALLPALLGAGNQYLAPLTQGYVGGIQLKRQELEAQRQEEIARLLQDYQDLNRQADIKENEIDKNRDFELKQQDFRENAFEREVSRLNELIQSSWHESKTWTDELNSQAMSAIEASAAALKMSPQAFLQRIRVPKIDQRTSLGHNENILGQISLGPYRTGDEKFDNMQPGLEKYQYAMGQRNNPAFARLTDDTLRELAKLPSYTKQQAIWRTRNDAKTIAELAENRGLSFDQYPFELSETAKEVRAMPQGMKDQWIDIQLNKFQLSKDLSTPQMVEDYYNLTSLELKMLDGWRKDTLAKTGGFPPDKGSPYFYEWTEYARVRGELAKQRTILDKHRSKKPKASSKPNGNQSSQMGSPIISWFDTPKE